ncbi:LysR family transcriptional regulator [Sessilibacter corallicola]|uniref:LysR family transcriptional regulator n=1 Tax=Sessilibacter corallicola TaxID=2904075 RepID=A0ABQ0A9R8_9GAMM
MKKAGEFNWNDLKYLLLVNQHGTLAKAADVLGVNHSTVFRRIKTLEDNFGVKLFKRLPDGYTLSNVGLDIVRYVGDIEDKISDIHRLLDITNDTMAGSINVTLPHNFGYRFLPPYIAEFQKLYPEVQINLLVTNSDSNLSKGEADLAIRACSSPPEHLVGQCLFSLPWKAFCSKEYLKTHDTPKDQTELNNHKIIATHNDLTYLSAFQWIEKNIPRANIVARSNDLVSMSALAEAGVGIALLPYDQNKNSLVALFTIDFAEPSDIWILSHPDMRSCKRLKVFKDFIIDKFKNDDIFREKFR